MTSPMTERSRRASWWAKTVGAGLSLGDRACVALALELDLPVFTADQSWALVKGLDLDLHLIR
jgi:ribonuclease VapC